MKKHSGFTILELMITLAIVAIVTSLAIPSLSQFIKNDRLVTQINTLVSHLAYARSEAVTRNQQVVICARGSDTSCGSDWKEGWLLFVDDGNGSLDIGTDTILRVQQTLEGQNLLFSSALIGNSVIYDYRGFASDSNGTFLLCDDRGQDFQKVISISNTGRVRQGGNATCP
jgi:type IV fimbrial biogenesis protein FimT